MAANTMNLDVDNFIAFAEKLLSRCKNFKQIEGSQKLERKIVSEIKFLKTLKKNSKPNASSHLKSSNLSHYAGVVHAAELLPGVIQVLQPFSSPGKSDSLTVDVVAGEGHMWVKVIARKAQALHLVWAGRGQFGERDLLQQVDEYKESAKIHPFNFLSPEVHFAFYNNVTDQMACTLETRSIRVWGHQVPVEDIVEQKLKSVLCLDSDDSDSEDYSDLEEPETLSVDKDSSNISILTSQITSNVSVFSDNKLTLSSNSEPTLSNIKPTLSSQILQNKQVLSNRQFSDNYFNVLNELLGVLPDYSQCDFSYDKILQYLNSIKKVNLDITTLIALVSGVTHGGDRFSFKEKILTQQAQEEREEPCVPIIMSFIKGKELYACKSAVEDFNTILNTLGGAGEKERAVKLLEEIQVVDDNPSERALQLKMFGKVKGRSRIIFGSGDTMKAITVTANSGFVRAARNQGISFAVFIHPARALTEQKEKTAISDELCDLNIKSDL